ncbi:hypothetical protein WJX74_001900 [Apatococcus lobatus]|uniref:Uncharacterized protein n=1 Tax=Apatococcus lobatus TaxID=904363 RepID=A0AAW1Q8M0_9CHLO
MAKARRVSQKARLSARQAPSKALHPKTPKTPSSSGSAQDCLSPSQAAELRTDAAQVQKCERLAAIQYVADYEKAAADALLALMAAGRLDGRTPRAASKRQREDDDYEYDCDAVVDGSSKRARRSTVTIPLSDQRACVVLTAMRPSLYDAESPSGPRDKRSINKGQSSTARKLSFQKPNPATRPAAAEAAFPIPSDPAKAAQEHRASHPAVLNCPSADFLYAFALHHQCPSPSGSVHSEQTFGPQLQSPPASQ